MPLGHIICVQYTHFVRLLLYLHVLASFGVACASEVVVKVDSLPDHLRPGGFGNVDLPAGTRIANRLVAPVDGTIVGVQILWGSPDGNAPPSQEAAIRVSIDESNAPYWPPQLNNLATIQSPVLLDGEVNEYRFLDPATETIPLSVPITAGTRFWVDLEFSHALDSASLPTIQMDNDAIHDDGSRLENYFLSARTHGEWWLFSGALLNGGDLGIRAIIQPVPEPSTYALAVLGMFGVLVARRSKRRR